MSYHPAIPVPSTPCDTSRRPWDQLPGEPALWYGRFCLYRDLGPGRTITGASRVERTAKGLHPWPPNESWHRASRSWYWRDRALAFDAHQREALTLCEYNLRLAARDRRVALIEDMTELVCAALDNANLPDLTQAEARKAFPQIRRFFIDLLTAERKEFEHPLAEEDARHPTITITADDLRHAERELARRQEFDRAPQLGDLAASTPSLPDSLAADPDSDLAGALPRRLPAAPLALPVVAISPAAVPVTRDRRLRLFVCPPLDVAHPGPVPAPLSTEDPPACSPMYASAGLEAAAMRAAGLPVSHVYHAHRTKFCEAFSRERTLRRPIELLHLDLPTNPQGIEFANGLTAPHWQIRHAECLRIVVLARHTGGAHRSTCFAHVPFVVTLDADLSLAAACTFTTHFWLAVAAGQSPPAAYAAALAACSPQTAARIACCAART